MMKRRLLLFFVIFELLLCLVIKILLYRLFISYLLRLSWHKVVLLCLSAIVLNLSSDVYVINALKVFLYCLFAVVSD